MFKNSPMNALWVSVALFLSNPQAALGERDHDVQIKKNVGNVISDSTLRTSGKLELLQVDEWADVVGRYGIKISPNQDRNTYSRKELLRFSFRIGDEVLSSIAINGRKQLEAEFIRQFPNQKEALSVTGDNKLYGVKNVPHSSESARKLKHGDYYKVNLRTAFEMSAHTALSSGISIASLKARYIVSGDFQMEVYKRQGDKVLVRGSSLKEKSTGLSFNFGSDFEFDIFSYNPLDNFVEKKINVDVIDWNILTLSHGKLFAVEFEFDLSTPGGRKAYDQLMNPSHWKLRDIAVVNPLRKGDDQKVLSLLIGKIEDSQKASLLQNGSKQLSISQTDFKKKTSHFAVNLIAGSSKRRTNYVEQDFQFKMGSQEQDYERYKIATLSLDRKYNIGVAWRERDQKREANIIFKLNENLDIVGFDELSFSFQRSDVRLRSKKCPLSVGQIQVLDVCQDELPSLYGQIRKMIPEKYHSSIPFQKMFLPLVNRSTFIDLELVFSPQAMRAFFKLTPEEIEQEIDLFLSQVRLKLSEGHEKFYGELEFLNHLEQLRKQNDLDRDASPFDEDAFYNEQADEIKEGLILVFRSPETARDFYQDWQILIRLYNNILFRDLGSGLLVRLLNRAAIKQSTPNFLSLVFLKVKLSSKGLEDQIKTIGDYTRPDYTSALIRTRNRLLNREFDPAYFEED